MRSCPPRRSPAAAPAARAGARNSRSRLVLRNQESGQLPPEDMMEETGGCQAGHP